MGMFETGEWEKGWIGCNRATVGAVFFVFFVIGRVRRKDCRFLAAAWRKGCRPLAAIRRKFVFFSEPRRFGGGTVFKRVACASRCFFVRPPRALRLSRLSRNQPLDTRDEILAIGLVVVAERQRPRARRKVYRLRLHLRVDSREIVAAVRNIQAFARVAHP